MNFHGYIWIGLTKVLSIYHCAVFFGPPCKLIPVFRKSYALKCTNSNMKFKKWPMVGFCERHPLPPNYVQLLADSAACWPVDQVALSFWLRHWCQPSVSLNKRILINNELPLMPTTPICWSARITLPQHQRSLSISLYGQGKIIWDWIHLRLRN